MAIISNPNSPVVVGTALDDQLFLEWNNVAFQWAYGGTGNDLYFLSGYGTNVAVVENAGEGTDTVELDEAYDDFTLGANIENLRIASVQIDTWSLFGPEFYEVEFTGNALNNVITVVSPVFDPYDILFGQTYATVVESIDGGAGNDTVIAQNNTFIGVVYVDSTTDIVQTLGNAVVDAVFSTATYTLGAGNIFALTLGGTANLNGTGNALNNEMLGNTGNNVLDGGAGNDELVGDEGNDTLLGGLGNDYLDGGAGNDSLQGGAGDDEYYVGPGDVIVEAIGAGYDTAYLASEIVTYTLAANLEAVHHEYADGNTTLRGNVLDNHLFGGSYIDALYGDAGNDVLDGGYSSDALYGGAGNDTYIVNEIFDRVFENAPDGIDTVFSTADFILSPNVENLVLAGTDDLRGYGNALNNIITGNAGYNLLSGGAGNDTLNGGEGFDDLFGGTGNDTYVYDGQDTLWEAFNEGTDTVLSGVDVNALFINIENLTLTGTANINGHGNSLNNIITGNAGNNELSGGGGVDTLIGGAGNDRYLIGNNATVTETIAGVPGGIDEVVYSGGGTYVLGLNVENLTIAGGTGFINGTGNTADNVIQGNAGDNQLDGGAGNDTLSGGAGNDTLIGGLGNDVLNGNAGDDLMKGGAGDDTYYVFSTGDVVDESTAATGAGIDTVRSNLRLTDLNNTAIFKNSLGTLPAGLAVIENVTLEASALDVIGNSLANVIRGNGAVNVLSGGAGNDTYYVDLTDVVDETLVKFTPSSPADAGGVDTVILDVGNASGAINMASRYANVENLTLLGTGNYNVTGTAAANILIGNDGNNSLHGGGGIDQLRGGKGNDTYQVDVAGDVVTELANEGIDTVYSQIAYTLGLNLENLRITGGGALAGTGNALNNEIWGGVGNNTLLGNDGNDTLFGLSGNDILNGGNGNDALNGGYGNDAMTGGLGDDTFFVDFTGDTTLEAAAQGYDTVVAMVDYTLAAGQSIERLVAAPGGDFDPTDPDFNLTGNNLDNLIVGNSGNNVLTGGTGGLTWGNDTFDASGGGNDTLNGGSGNDTFLFNGGSLDGADTMAGGLGTDTLIAEFAGTLGAVGAPVGLNIGGVEHLRFNAAQWAEAFVDFSPAAGTAGVQTITLSTAFGSGAKVGLYDLSGFGTLGTPTLLLQDFLGVAGMGSYVQTRLTNDGGPPDEVRFDLDGVWTRLDTWNVDTVGLHVVGSGSGSAGVNQIEASFWATTQINLSSANGAQNLVLSNLDNAALTGDAQTIGLLGYQGTLELRLDNATGGADLVGLKLDNTQTILHSTGIEHYTLEGVGDPGIFSGISLRNAQDTDSITVIGEGDLLVRDFIAPVFDASQFMGNSVRAFSFYDSNGAGNGGTGTTFTASDNPEVSEQFFGGSGNDTFNFGYNGGASLTRIDSVNGGDGLGSTDTVNARIDGLLAGTTGALRFTGIEVANFTNNLSGSLGAPSASLDGSNMGGGQFNLFGSGEWGDAIDTLFVAFRGHLDASAYTGDVQVNAATGITTAHTYTLGLGNHNINGASAFGVHDTFNFNSIHGIDSGDFVNGFDTDTTGGGDVLNATVDGLNATTGMLRIQGIETFNLVTAGESSTIDGADIDGVYFWNITGSQSLVLSGLDATSAVFNANDLTGALFLTAGAGNDNITGTGNGDALDGGAGNDRIDGRGGSNNLYGGAGNDTLVWNDNATTYDGGNAPGSLTDWLASGFDTLDASATASAITANLTTGAVTGGGTLVNIDRILGGSGADTLTGYTTAPSLLNAIPTRTSADTALTFRGNAGDDTIIGSNTGAEGTVPGQAAWGYNTRIEYTGASAGVAVWLGMRTGETTAEFLDITGVDFGLTGIDVGTPGRAFDGDGGTDTISYIDLVRGSAHDDILVGGSDSRAYGGARFEAFEGGAGNDLIAGGLSENAGDTDRVDYSNDPGSVYVDLNLGYAFDGYGGTDTLHEINDVRGSNFGDVLIGGNVFNNDFGEVFEGMGGDDVIDGGSGIDFVSFQAAPIALGAAGVTVNLVTGVSSGTGVGVDSFINIEGVRGSDGNDTITGGSNTYQLNGQSYEVFRPNGGADTVDGGAGIDRIDYTNDVDTQVAAFSGASDGWGVLVNLGGALDATAIGIRATGSDWDTLDLTLAANRAFDGWGYTDILANIEDIRGSRHNDVLIGNAQNNVIQGRNGNDYLDGGAGNDTLEGDDGNDTLIGGTGNDTLTGGNGSDFFVFNAATSATNIDTITAFTTTSDKLQLDDAIFTAIGPLGALNATAFVSGVGLTEGADASDRLVYNTTTGALYYDVDGIGGTAAVQIATITGAPALVAADVQVI